jgi:hypothetical protein
MIGYIRDKVLIGKVFQLVWRQISRTRMARKRLSGLTRQVIPLRAKEVQPRQTGLIRLTWGRKTPICHLSDTRAA